MPWRVIAHGNEVYHVDAIAERRAHTQAWQLALSFRAASNGPQGGQERGRGPTMWALYPLEASSRSSLFIQAERIPDAELTRILAERLA